VDTLEFKPSTDYLEDLIQLLWHVCQWSQVLTHYDDPACSQPGGPALRQRGHRLRIRVLDWTIWLPFPKVWTRHCWARGIDRVVVQIRMTYNKKI